MGSPVHPVFQTILDACQRTQFQPGDTLQDVIARIDASLSETEARLGGTLAHIREQHDRLKLLVAEPEGHA